MVETVHLLRGDAEESQTGLVTLNRYKFNGPLFLFNQQTHQILNYRYDKAIKLVCDINGTMQMEYRNTVVQDA